jgi:hypothetical protein
VPAGAPTLVLAVPAEATPEAVAVVDELISVIRGEQPGIEVAAGWLPGAPTAEQDAPHADERHSGEQTDTQDGEQAEGRFAESWSTAAPQPQPTVEALLAAAAEAGLPMPVLVPLLSGPHPYLTTLHELAGWAGATVTDVLGPHPLLAEAVHVRLSEAGLARADRARLFAITTAADGVVLTTVGGEEAAAAAGITGVLLAARLAVPVVPAALDVPGSVAAAVEHLRATGSQRPALAPLVIGPEAAGDLLQAATEETGCPTAAPLGAYPTVGQLIASGYLAALPPRPVEEEAPQEEPQETAEQA